MSGAARIGFIGGGNMAGAMLGGLLRAGHPAERLAVADPDPARRRAIAALDPGIAVGDDNGVVAAAAEVLVLAVKPQVMAAVAAGLGPRPAGQLVLSIAAGVTLESLGRWLGRGTARVRVMPNQPALVGAGAAVMVASPEVTPAQRGVAETVTAATGFSAWVEDEALMDAVTAVSGSGPAYFYLLVEALAAAGESLGLPAELAQRLARETASGAGATLGARPESAAALRRSVTSPGGTTAAAVALLEAGGIRDIVRRAVTAARDRSRELGAGD